MNHHKVLASLATILLLSLVPPGVQAIAPPVGNEEPIPDDGIEYSNTTLPTIAYMNGTSPLTLIGEENDVEYVRISMENVSFTREPGRPMMPEVPMLFVIPPTALNVTGTNFTSDPVTQTPPELAERTIVPAQFPDSDNRTGIAIQDNTTYGTSAWYPSEVVEITSEGFIGHYRVVSTVVHPVQYNPTTDEIRVHEDLEVEIDYDPDPNWTPETDERDGAMDRMVKGLVANPSQVEAFYAPTATGPGCEIEPTADAALLVPEVDQAGSDGLRAAFETYGTRRTLTGVPILTVPVDATAGAAHIRDVIEDVRCDHGIQAFLLGGSAHSGPPVNEGPPVFPPWYEEMTTKNILNQNPLTMDEVTTNVSSDWEYALLDSPLGRDAFPDVLVGRLPFWSATQVLDYQRRFESYERANVTGGQTRATYTNAYLLAAHYLEDGSHTNTDGEAVSTTIGTHLAASSGDFNVHEDSPDVNPPRKSEDVKKVIDGGGSELDPPVPLVGGVGYTNLATDGWALDQAYSNRKGEDNLNNIVQVGHLTGFPSEAAHVLYSLSSYGGTIDPRALDPNGPSMAFVPESLTPDKGVIAGIGNSAHFLYFFDAAGSAPAEELNSNFYRFLADSQAPDGVAQQGLGAVFFAAKAGLVAQAEHESQGESHAGFGLVLRSFNLFGDPTLVPWTREPQELEPEYVPFVQPGDTLQISIDVDTAYLPNEVRVHLGNTSITEFVEGPASINITAPTISGETDLAIRVGHHALHLDQVLVDDTPPSIDALNLTSHPDASLRYSNSTVKGDIVSTDDGQVQGYAALVSPNSTDVPEPVLTHEASPVELTAPSDGVWYLHVRSVDAAGNWGQTTSREFSVDTTAPTSWLNLTAEGGLDPTDLWYRTDVTLSMEATDSWHGQSPDSSLIGTSATSLEEYVSPVTETAEGAHEYHFQSADAAVPANIEPLRDLAFGIDRSSPTDSWVSSPEREPLNVSFPVSWGANDTLSGVYIYTVEVRESNGTWDPWLENTTLGSATYTGVRGLTYEFRVAVLDRAGNRLDFPSSSQSSTYVNLAPIADAGGNQTVSYDENLLNGVTFDGSGSFDPDGQVVEWEWDFGDGSPLAHGEVVNHKYDAQGEYVVRLRVIDNDGLDGESNAWVQILIEVNGEG